MSTKSIVLLDSSLTFLNITGVPKKAAGYFGSTAGLHTIQITIQDFVGRIYIECSLASNPTDTDWFPVQITPSSVYLEFPVNPLAPSATHGDTACLGCIFNINAVWIRARVDRSYLINPDPSACGIVNRILLNY